MASMMSYLGCQAPIQATTASKSALPVSTAQPLSKPETAPVSSKEAPRDEADNAIPKAKARGERSILLSIYHYFSMHSIYTFC